MPIRLFVYGTLLSGSAVPMARRLHEHARLIGPGCIAGRLYAISIYPAAVAGDDTGEHMQGEVWGEVWALATPATTLRVMDAYEHTVAGNPAISTYLRRACTVRLDAGGEVDAWTYLWNRRLFGATRMASGQWPIERSVRLPGW